MVYNQPEANIQAGKEENNLLGATVLHWGAHALLHGATHCHDAQLLHCCTHLLHPRANHECTRFLASSLQEQDY